MSKDSISKLKTCRNLTTLKLRSNPITDTYTTGLRGNPLLINQI